MSDGESTAKSTTVMVVISQTFFSLKLITEHINDITIPFKHKAIGFKRWKQPHGVNIMAPPACAVRRMKM